jgi:hypothetical protein
MNIENTSNSHDYHRLLCCHGTVRDSVNRNYQRSDQVWPAIAKSYLIETILLGYPVPKLSLYQVLDLKSRKTSKEIVDGQQRSVTIEAYPVVPGSSTFSV